MKRSLQDFTEADRIRSEGAVEAAVDYLAAIDDLETALAEEHLSRVTAALERLKEWPQSLDCLEADAVRASEDALHQKLTELGLAREGTLRSRLETLVNSAVVRWPARWWSPPPAREADWVRLGSRSVNLNRVVVTRLDEKSAELNGVRARVSTLERLGVVVPAPDPPVRALPRDSERRRSESPDASPAREPLMSAVGKSARVMMVGIIVAGATAVSGIPWLLFGMRLTPLGQSLCVITCVAAIVVVAVASAFSRP